MSPRFMPRRREEPVSKDKKKKDGTKPKKKDGASAAKSLKSLSQNPLVADVVAAALVSMAAALKDSDKARRLANDAGEQLNALSKKSSKQGNAMWDLALDVGRRTLETLAGEESARVKSAKK
jgi:hypothetical protein